MQVIDGQLIYSATDLVGFIECAHLANLDRAVAERRLEPPREKDPVLERIAQRGTEHEQRFLDDLRTADGSLRVEVIPDGDRDLPSAERLARGRAPTLNAMRSGADVIYQAVLYDGRRQGYADFLRRVETPSDLGGWSYEVWDTKLARSAKASAVLQLCLYSEMVTAMQGRAPDQMHLALGGVEAKTASFRVADYAAYYRLVVSQLEAHLARNEAVPPGEAVPSTPEPTDHCAVCRWSRRCTDELRAADDLSRVAGLSARQRKGLIEVAIPTRTALARTETLPADVPGASRAALDRVREQARVQVEGERLGRPYFERIAPPRNREGVLLPNFGLGMLPAPSPGDLFFDIEGDPFYSSPDADGVDYLFGVIEPGERDASGEPRFHAFWAIDAGEVTPAAERRAFEQFIDVAMDRLRRDPGMHVYHYAPYEPTAVKRLAGRYATREAEVDELLRGGVFVDLYRAVRQGIRAAVESYSIKKLEPLYGYGRSVDLRDAGTSIVEFETWLELGDTGEPGRERERLLADIEAYNRDDCVSTWRLRDWLEEQRAALDGELVAETGEGLPRARVIEPEQREASERQQRIADLAARLVEGVPDEGRTPEQRARWLLAQMLNWHAREQKSFWWRYFFLMNELTDDERREESDALGELTYEGVVDTVKQSLVHRLRFPPQDHKLRVGDSPHDPVTGRAAGEIVAIDDSGYVDLKLGKRRPPPSCTSLVPHDLIPPKPKPEAIERLAEHVLARGIEGPGRFRVSRDLLLHAPPRFHAGTLEPAIGELAEEVARRQVLELDASYLAIQGPPGSGKTTVGGKMIADLVAVGRTVGVTAGSHKVIGNLLDAAAEAARERGLRIAIGQKGDGDGPTCASAIDLPDNADLAAALADGSVQVAGATTWSWAREEMEASVDVLFIDEAGQMSLADALAASLAAESVVLLGDPQQLDQPLQGTHPPGAERSALAHVLDGASTMPAAVGLFLDGTWRLHPAITDYTSEVFYEGRLHSHPGRDRQRVAAPDSPLDGAGLRFVPVLHRSNSSESVEEAGAIEEILDALLVPGATTVNAAGEAEPLSADDVLLITPYNAQVRLLEEVLGSLRIGTVDKFQGQQAPISIYSMATSSALEAPRGMEFLYSLNRLNVATSRAKSVAVVVASPELLLARCRTPRQMRLVNALARLVELARSGGGRPD
ncbi:MAG: TM0106 family RecB-like putative nuclease [Dehalococcoidia bacterium]